MILLKSTGDDFQETETTRKKKQRKAVREMKLYTGRRVGGEKAYKGWSARAFVELLEVKTAILADKVRYSEWTTEHKCRMEITVLV